MKLLSAPIFLFNQLHPQIRLAPSLSRGFAQAGFSLAIDSNNYSWIPFMLWSYRI